jgi:hypothetical protein
MSSAIRSSLVLAMHVSVVLFRLPRKMLPDVEV